GKVIPDGSFLPRGLRVDIIGLCDADAPTLARFTSHTALESPILRRSRAEGNSRPFQVSETAAWRRKTVAPGRQPVEIDPRQHQPRRGVRSLKVLPPTEQDLQWCQRRGIL